MMTWISNLMKTLALKEAVGQLYAINFGILVVGLINDRLIRKLYLISDCKTLRLRKWSVVK